MILSKKYNKKEENRRHANKTTYSPEDEEGRGLTRPTRKNKKVPLYEDPDDYLDED